ncbi:uncharacterized protein LOC123273929 [Cotesia glomerata]|uniref:uncharacterized protein LOC123273929 n=1 Tax=Cotesia glomerata TaxID=32391 RepID=UPI001D002FCD|nr:uncharacterized protein LOC123273929 [Cotesia glomerata]
MSSQLLITGVPHSINVDLTPNQIVHQIFDKLGIANLTNDVLTIREFKGKKNQSNTNSQQISHSFILNLKSPQVCEHIIDTKRRTPKLFAKNIFNSNADIAPEKLIFINEFLHGDLYPAHLAQFEFLVNEYKPHIITIVESWLNPDIQISLKDYSIIRCDRGLLNTNGNYIRGGGIICFINNCLKAKLLYSSESQDINNPEFIIVDVILPSGSHILLSSIYRRPQGKLLDSFYTKFGKFYPSYKNILIMGDLNCNLLKSNRQSNHLKSFISESGLYCIPYGPTFHTTETESWLDVIIIDNEDKLGRYSKSSLPFIGGHDYLLCEYRLESPIKYDKKVEFRDFRNCNHAALANDLNSKLNQININFEEADPNDLTSYFNKSIIASLNNFAPLTEKKLKRPNNPWLTNALRREFRERDTLYKRARRTGDQNLLRLYKMKRKDLKNKLNIARDIYFKTILENSSQKSNKSSSLLNWKQIDIVDVTKNLQLTLQKSKGKSPDGLDIKWLKDHLQQVSIFLMNNLNRSLETSIFPEAWKSVFIVPLNKINLPKSISDTRPIANLSHFAKVFERIIANQLVEYLELNNLLDDYQSGFRKFHSTQGALLLLTEEIRRAIDREDLTYLILFDFSKAFDYLNPKILYITMYEMGFSIEVICWFQSYLTRRSQSVLDLSSVPSSPISTTSGVPQGSILGPILFLIVINGVAKRLKYTKHGLFADDKYTYLHFKLYELNRAAYKLNVDAQAVADWARENGIKINLQKTKVMILGSNSKLKLLEGYDLPQITIDGKVIPYVNSTKHLGIYLTNNHSWDIHVAHITRKVYGALNSLKHRKNILSTYTRKLLITATILPIIEYCSLVLLDSSKRLDYKLQRLINN